MVSSADIEATGVPTDPEPPSPRGPLDLGRKVIVGGLFVLAFAASFLPLVVHEVRGPRAAAHGALDDGDYFRDVQWTMAFVQLVLVPALGFVGAWVVRRRRPVVVALLAGTFALYLVSAGRMILSFDLPAGFYLGCVLVIGLTIGAATLGERLSRSDHVRP